MSNLTIDDILEVCRKVVPTAKIMPSVDERIKERDEMFLKRHQQKLNDLEKHKNTNPNKPLESQDLSAKMGYGLKNGKSNGD